MEAILLKILGEPVPWAAPRITRGGSYDTKADKKKAISWALKAQFLDSYQKGSIDRLELPLTDALRIDFFFGMPIPKATSQKNRALMMHGKIFHTKKPDLDNLRKLLSDCLQTAGIIKNDSQVVAGESRKFYAETPHTVIRIKRMEVEYED